MRLASQPLPPAGEVAAHGSAGEGGALRVPDNDKKIVIPAEAGIQLFGKFVERWIPA
jgi:hypothetical protein